jgi:hypothetical protein
VRWCEIVLQLPKAQSCVREVRTSASTTSSHDASQECKTPCSDSLISHAHHLACTNISHCQRCDLQHCFQFFLSNTDKLHPRLGHHTCTQGLATTHAPKAWPPHMHPRLGHHTCTQGLATTHAPNLAAQGARCGTQGARGAGEASPARFCRGRLTVRCPESSFSCKKHHTCTHVHVRCLIEHGKAILTRLVLNTTNQSWLHC